MKKDAVRGALREATAAVHQQLHEAGPFVAIAEQRLDLRDYADLLRQIAAFHFTVSRAVPGDRSREDRLRADLHALGAPPPEMLGWTAPGSPAARLGCTYVVEGSRLGGKLIYRQLDYLFGESEAGRCFFRGSPSDSLRWRSLCERLEHEGREQPALDEMIAGARATFALFERIVCPVHAHA